MDSTLLVQLARRFYYVERRKNNKQDVIASHNLADCPKELHKKIAILQHFKRNLETGSKRKHLEQTEIKEARESAFVYVKKWIRTQHAILFRLSNKIVQTVFEDRTEILLCSETREVTYLDKRGARISYALATVMEADDSAMIKSFSYTRDVLLRSSRGKGQAKS